MSNGENIPTKRVLALTDIRTTGPGDRQCHQGCMWLRNGPMCGLFHAYLIDPPDDGLLIRDPRCTDAEKRAVDHEAMVTAMGEIRVEVGRQLQMSREIVEAADRGEVDFPGDLGDTERNPSPEEKSRRHREILEEEDARMAGIGGVVAILSRASA